MKYILSVMMLSLFSMLAGAQKTAWTASDIADSLRKEAYSVVRDYQTAVTAPSMTQMSMHCRKVVTVLNKKGDRHAMWSCSTSRFSQLVSFSGKVYDASGKVIQKLKRSDLHTTQYSEHLATDVQYHYVQSPVTDYPYTVEYEWEEKSNDGYTEYDYFLPLKHEHQSLENASFTLTVPAATEIRQLCLPHAWPQEKKTSVTDDVYVWSVPAMKCMVYDEYEDHPMYFMPSIIAMPMNYRFGASTGTQDSWESKGKWYAQLAEGRDVLLPQDREKVHELISACTTDYDKILALYRYLGEKTRYVSIQLGIGGWQPMSAEEVGRTGFGDCKALANYMQALLKEAGITSYQTIISTEYKDLLDGFPNMHQTDHVILTIPRADGSSLVVECTNPHLPLGYIPGSYAGHEALQIKEDNSTLTRIRDYSAEDNYEDMKADIALSPDGKADISYSCDHYGARYGLVRSLVDQDDKERRDRLRRWINLADPVVGNVKVDEQKNDAPHINVQFDAKASYGKVVGSKIFVPCCPFHAVSVPRFRADRQRPIVLESAYALNDEIRIAIPEGYTYTAGEMRDSVVTDFGSCTIHVRQEGRTVIVTGKSVAVKGHFDISRKEEFVAYREKLSKMSRRQIVLDRM